MTDQDYMRRAINLARQGEGWTSPNPMVGAVIVKGDVIIGEGYHARCGGLHAEREAIASLRESAEGATLYVTLEPCCHYGRTPPCTEAILEQKIARVVIGSRDPNPLVAGKGAALLRAAGVQVEKDFMREECDRLNPIFFHYITCKTPYVVMKYAMTADGKIATGSGASKWVTGETARQMVQQFRHRCSGIMVGIGTVLADDPMLNCRLEGKRSPVRIVCDSRLRIPLDAKLCRTAKDYRTIVVCAWEPEAAAAGPDLCLGQQAADAPSQRPNQTVGTPHQQTFREKRHALEALGVEVVSLPSAHGKVDLCRLMEYLGSIGIDSVLLEGGGSLNESALRAGIVHEVKAFIAPKIFGGVQAKSPVAGCGVEAPDQAYGLRLERVTTVGGDILLEYQVKGR